jgi:hypothetical protein
LKVTPFIQSLGTLQNSMERPVPLANFVLLVSSYSDGMVNVIVTLVAEELKGKRDPQEALSRALSKSCHRNSQGRWKHPSSSVRDFIRTERLV